MKAVFDNLTSGAGQRVEQELNAESSAHKEADSIEVSSLLGLVLGCMLLSGPRPSEKIWNSAMDWC